MGGDEDRCSSEEGAGARATHAARTSGPGGDWLDDPESDRERPSRAALSHYPQASNGPNHRASRTAERRGRWVGAATVRVASLATRRAGSTWLATRSRRPQAQSRKTIYGKTRKEAAEK